MAKTDNVTPVSAKKDLSVIVNAHNENTLLHRTLKSIQRNIDHLNDDVRVEVIIVADKVDDLTKDYLENRLDLSLSVKDVSVEYVQYGDLGESRNHGVELATGEYVANFDGDDIWCDNWLSDSLEYIKDKPDVILHPEVVVSFGAKHNVWHVKSSLSEAFDPRSIVEDNWWTSCMMTRRTVFDKVKYRKTLRQRGFSFEDWLWNCDTLAKGIEHVTVPKTVWFYRRKPTSMLTQQLGGIVSSNALMTPSGLNRYVEQRTKKKVESTRKPEQKKIDVKTDSIVPNASSLRTGVIKIVKGGGKVVLKAGRKLGGSYLKRHGRLERFARTIVSASRELVQTPAPRKARIKSGLHMYNGVYVPEWVVAEWKRQNDIDPEIFPTRERLYSLHERQLMTMGREQEIYWSLAEDIGENVDFLIATPWLKTSGASLVVLHYANAYIENNPDAKVVVVATEGVDHPWADRLDKRIKFIEAGPRLARLTKNEQSKVIAKLTVQLKPENLHIIHSQEFFKALNLYPGQMSLNTKVFVSAFSYDYSSEGMRQSAFLMNIEPALPYITRVFCDNDWIASDSIDVFGVPEDLFVTHRMPLSDESAEIAEKIDDNEQATLGRKDSGTLRVLWASRIAKAKRPDILYNIVRRAGELKLNIEFTIYGELYGRSVDPSLLDKIASLPNVKYMGGFTNGVTNIPAVREYDVYLFTSEGEGMPNAVIEAQSVGLPVIASSVGGVPETVVANETGVPVTPFDDVQQYIDALIELQEDSEMRRRLGVKAQEEVAKGRSWGAFVQSVKDTI